MAIKIIGLMLTWNNLEFFRYSVHQARSFCDELIVVEGCHSQQYPKHSTDGTCEYIDSIRDLPKLRVMDFVLKGRYDSVQRKMRSDFPKTSKFYEKDNWVFHWDDDCFFMEEELPKVRVTMETTTYDSISYGTRNFIYNFRFNTRGSESLDSYRIIDNMYLTGINKPYYKSRRRFPFYHIDGVTLFHYTYVKKPERFNARMLMSIEKGCTVSVGRYKQWMSVKWEKDEDIFKSKTIIKNIRGDEELNIYSGDHPEAVANHPWRHINDIREIK